MERPHSAAAPAETPAPRPAWRRDLRSVLLAAGALALAAWVQRLAFTGFFAADDILHLEQAAGLVPTPAVPWRVLTQVIYFRAMLWGFGPVPGPWIAANLLLHLTNAALLFALARGAGASRAAATLATVAFAASPLLTSAIAHPVIVNDLAAIAFALALALLVQRSRPAPWPALVLLPLLSMFCKESALFVPFAILAHPANAADRAATLRRVAPALATAAVFAVAFLAMRAVGLGPAGIAYQVGFGAHIVHNLMTYTAWAVDLWRPVPDLVRSFDPGAWRIGVPALGVLAAAWWLCPARRAPIGYGVVWWLLGLLPVLALENSAYAYYQYAALGGLVLALAVSVEGLLGRALPLAPRGRDRAVAAALAVVAIGFALRAETMVTRRFSARTADGTLPLDATLRSMVVAKRAVVSLGSTLAGWSKRIVVLSPSVWEHVYGARSGRAFASAGGRPVYNLFEVVVDHGRGLRVFYPQLDSVRIVRRWTAADDGDLVLHTAAGALEFLGEGPAAHVRVAEALLVSGHAAAALDHLVEARRVFPDSRELLYLEGGARFVGGQREAARERLERVLAGGPADTLASAARELLERVGRE